MADRQSQEPSQPAQGHPTEPIPLRPAIVPFAGRIGGNQALVLNPYDLRNEVILQKIPDAAPYINIHDWFNLAGFLDVQLWNSSVIWTTMIVFCTAWISLHPPTNLNSTSSTLGPSGVYGTTRFLAPLVGGIGNWLTLTLLIYTFSSVSGAHLNPTITFATFFARIITFPRLVTYFIGQILGGTVAGFILRSAYGTRNFQAGGCAVDTESVPVQDAFVLEFSFTLILIFFSFGAGLDPRQAEVIGSTLSPWLVGLVLGLLSFGSSFTRNEYGGASMNPARCFGVYVGSSFPSYHWLHWVAPLAATMGHGIVYAIVPPWDAGKRPSSHRSSVTPLNA